MGDGALVDADYRYGPNVAIASPCDGFRQGLGGSIAEAAGSLWFRLKYVILLNQLSGDNFDIYEKSGKKKHAHSLHVAAFTQAIA